MNVPKSRRPPLEPKSIRITALGTGRPFPRLAQVNSGWLIELGNGNKFVFDFGYGSFQRFASLEIPMSELTGLFTTHLHTDHVGDFAAYWLGARIAGRVQPLSFYGPSGSVDEHGFAYFARHQIESYSWDMATRRGLLPDAGEQANVNQFPWDVEEAVYEKEGVRISSFPAIHIADGAVGLVLEWEGLKVVYSGDTAPSQILVDAARGADVLIHETANTTAQMQRRSGYTKDQAAKIGGSFAHTQPHELGQILGIVRPRIAVAFHFNNDVDTAQDVNDAIRSRYSGPLLLARDLATVTVDHRSIDVGEAVVSNHSWPNTTDYDDYRQAARTGRPPLSSWVKEARLNFDGNSSQIQK